MESDVAPTSDDHTIAGMVTDYEDHAASGVEGNERLSYDEEDHGLTLTPARSLPMEMHTSAAPDRTCTFDNTGILRYIEKEQGVPYQEDLKPTVVRIKKERKAMLLAAVGGTNEIGTLVAEFKSGRQSTSVFIYLVCGNTNGTVVERKLKEEDLDDYIIMSKTINDFLKSNTKGLQEKDYRAVFLYYALICSLRETVTFRRGELPRLLDFIRSKSRRQPGILVTRAMAALNELPQMRQLSFFTNPRLDWRSHPIINAKIDRSLVISYVKYNVRNPIWTFWEWNYAYQVVCSLEYGGLRFQETQMDITQQIEFILRKKSTSVINSSPISGEGFVVFNEQDFRETFQSTVGEMRTASPKALGPTTHNEIWYEIFIPTVLAENTALN